MADVERVAGKSDPVESIGGGARYPVIPPDYNVLLVVIDDIGSEWMEWQGLGERYCTDPDFQYAYTPFLSSVADEGIWFSDWYAESTCGPTRCCINTGTRSDRHGIGRNHRDPGTPLSVDNPSYGLQMSASLTFLAEHLRNVRPVINTGAFGKWHMADSYSSVVSGDTPVTGPDINLADYTKLGYQTYKGNTYNVGGRYSWWKTENGVVQPVLTTPPVDETTYPTGVNATDAMAWLSTRSAPFFCYLAFGPPHQQVTVPPFSMLSASTQTALTAAGLVAGAALLDSASYADTNFPLIWRASMEATDTAIQRCWNAIPAAQRAKTVLIVTGDNGTLGNALPPGFVHAKREQHRGGCQAPLVIKGPMVAHPGRVVSQISHVSDLFATVASIMQCPLSGIVAQDSVSLMPVIKDTVNRRDVNALHDYIVTQTFSPVGVTNPASWLPSRRQRGIYDGRHRLINIVGAKQLYDNRSDFVEAHDLLSGAVGVVEQGIADSLEAALDAILPI